MPKEIKEKIIEWGKKFNLSWVEEKEIYVFILELFAQEKQKWVEELEKLKREQNYQLSGLEGTELEDQKIYCEGIEDCIKRIKIKNEKAGGGEAVAS